MADRVSARVRHPLFQARQTRYRRGSIPPGSILRRPVSGAAFFHGHVRSLIELQRLVLPAAGVVAVVVGFGFLEVGLGDERYMAVEEQPVGAVAVAVEADADDALVATDMPASPKVVPRADVIVRCVRGIGP